MGKKRCPVHEPISDSAAYFSCSCDKEPRPSSKLDKLDEMEDELDDTVAKLSHINWKAENYATAPGKVSDFRRWLREIADDVDFLKRTLKRLQPKVEVCWECSKPPSLPNNPLEQCAEDGCDRFIHVLHSEYYGGQNVYWYEEGMFCSEHSKGKTTRTKWDEK